MAIIKKLTNNLFSDIPVHDRHDDSVNEELQIIFSGLNALDDGAERFVLRSFISDITFYFTVLVINFIA